MSPLVRLDAVTKDYLADNQRVRAVDGVTLTIEPGQFVSLVGRSGCGKSTLLNLAGAMDFPSEGAVVIDGTTTTTLDDGTLTRLRREKIGFVFQSFQLLPTLTVLENVELPGLLAGRADARAAAIRQLALVEMAPLASRYPHQLSGGQMQRVAIARALVNGPKLLLADEPTGNLDSTTGQLILDVLRRVADDQGAAVVMATHSADAAAIADVVVRLRDGRIEQVTDIGARGAGRGTGDDGGTEARDGEATGDR